MSPEKRKTPRKIADEVLEISDHLTRTLLGRVVNISTEGLMMLSDEAFTAGSIYQLDLKLPQPIRASSLVSFGAEAVWTTPSAQPGSHWTGFRIIDIADEDMRVIEELILDWSTGE